MILGLPVASFVAQFVLPAIVIAAMFAAGYWRGRRTRGEK